MDTLDALWVLAMIDDHGGIRTNEEDQSFLDTLTDELHDGRRGQLTAAEQSRLCTCARAVGMWWIDAWVAATEGRGHG